MGVRDIKERVSQASTQANDAVDALQAASRLLDGVSDRLRDEIESTLGRACEAATHLMETARALDGVL